MQKAANDAQFAPSRRGSTSSSEAHTMIAGTPPDHSEKKHVKGEVLKGATQSERPDGKIELTDSDCYEVLGFCYPTFKKWWILSVIFAIQVSMNINTSLYSNAVPLLSEEFAISEQAARVGQMIFLVAYAFGSELWAPWSEELGRWPIIQLSLFFVNVWQIPCALAPNFGTIVVGRFLGGISSAGGSVTLGMVADMWNEMDQQWAVAFIVFSSVGGSALGPVVGGFIGTYLNWHWNFWIQLILGGVVQAVHFFTVDETRSAALVTREAKRRRKAGETNVYSTDELKEHRFTVKGILTTWSRPFVMFATEPIVLCLSLLSGFSDALIFTFLEGFTPVFKQWGFSDPQVGLSFIAILVGYCLAYLIYLPDIARQRKKRKVNPESYRAEDRLYLLLWLAPLETIGLFGFAWTSLGPPRVSHWIAPMIFAALVGIANLAIYQATIDYMVSAYGEYSSSATGGNALARDFLAGIAAMYATPFYTNLPAPYTLEYPSTILACISFVVIIPVYVFYFNGEWFRDRSKFAQSLATDRQAKGDYGAAMEMKANKGNARHLEEA